jgi:hypothetical protein
MDSGPVLRERPPCDDAAPFERVADDAEVGKHRDAESLGDHQLAHLGSVRGVGEHRQLVAEEPVQVPVHDIARTHADQRDRAQIADGDLRPVSERAVRPQAHDRVPEQQRGRLKFWRHVVAFQAVHQAQVGAALQEPALDVGVRAADHLHLGSGCVSRNCLMAGASSGTVAVFTVPIRTTRLVWCCSSAAWRRRSTASSTVSMCCRRSRPLPLSRAPCRLRSRRCTPSSRSRLRTDSLSAGCEMCSASAAFRQEPSRATAAMYGIEIAMPFAPANGAPAPTAPAAAS